MKKVLSCFLCAALILGITGCSEGGDPNTTTREIVTKDFSGVDITAAPDIDIKGKKLVYLGGYDITDEGDSPIYQFFKETYGADVEIDKYSGNLMEKMSTMINSGESPDLVDQNDSSFPYYIGQNSYTALDDYIDLSAPQWKDVKSYIESFAVKGKHYYYPWIFYVSPNILMYNRGKFKELGIDDPKELYDKNNWTWDTFAKCMTDFVNSVKGEDPYALGVYGYMNTGFINSTGVALVDYKDGQLVSNLNDPNVDRAQRFLEDLKKKGLSYKYYDDGNGDHISESAVVDGHAAFQAMGDWKFAAYSQKMDKDDTLDFFFVPYPRDPNADKYYHNLNSFGYLVPAGAPNVDVATAYINCVRLCKLDERFKQLDKNDKMKKDGECYTEEQYEFWYFFQQPSNFESDQLIYDLARHMGDNTTNDIISPILEDVPFTDNEDTQSWTAMRSSMAPLLDNTISQINATLK